MYLTILTSPNYPVLLNSTNTIIQTYETFSNTVRLYSVILQHCQHSCSTSQHNTIIHHAPSHCNTSKINKITQTHYNLSIAFKHTIQALCNTPQHFCITLQCCHNWLTIQFWITHSNLTFTSYIRNTQASSMKFSFIEDRKTTLTRL